jgi:glycosyltransferase involved in cell wall biosynthesis
VYVSNNNQGGFCLWESIATLMDYVSEYVIYDGGSTDGTLDTLQEIEKANSKFRVIEGKWTKNDPSSFPIAANETIAQCKYDNVLCHQADEIWHPDLLGIMKKKFEKNQFNLAFWRIQYIYNFQQVKWFPHLVHRVGQKDNFNFQDDGMNTEQIREANICSDYDGNWYPKWGSLGGNKETAQEKIKPYVNQMILDISQTGAFLNTIIKKRKLAEMFWGKEAMIVEGQSFKDWYEKQNDNPDWQKIESPYNIPKIMRFHVGKQIYIVRDDLIEAIKNNDTKNFIFD